MTLPPCPYCGQNTLAIDDYRIRCHSAECVAAAAVSGFPPRPRLLVAPGLIVGANADKVTGAAVVAGYQRRPNVLGYWTWELAEKAHFPAKPAVEAG